MENPFNFCFVPEGQITPSPKSPYTICPSHPDLLQTVPSRWRKLRVFGQEGEGKEVSRNLMMLKERMSLLLPPVRPECWRILNRPATSGRAFCGQFTHTLSARTHTHRDEAAQFNPATCGTGSSANIHRNRQTAWRPAQPVLIRWPRERRWGQVIE